MIGNEDMTLLKAVFVTREECNDTTDAIRQEVADSRKDSAVVNAKLNFIIGVLSIIGAALVPVIIKLLFRV